jgi:actin-like ATPase involved in cell morphogenesis
MAYYLGVDVGTSYTAAAIWRDRLVEVVPLGRRAPVVPSVVLLPEHGEVLVGEAAERSSDADPLRVAREFKRWLGEPTPVVLDGEPHSVEDLTARLLRWVVDEVTRREGTWPAGIAVTRPVTWGDYENELLRQAFVQAGLFDVTVVTEPEAAAVYYATYQRPAPGAVVAVYDLGGGTFDVAVLCRTDTGWEVLGQPRGIERLGGVDVDEAVFSHVTEVAGNPLDGLDPDDADAVAAVARLRHDCVVAKETLSATTEVSIPLRLPGLDSKVRLTREQLETRVRPALARSITALDRTLESAGVETSDLDAVLLMGGSSRIPLVAEMVGAHLGRPVAADRHAKIGVALGAAVVAAERDVSDAAMSSTIGPGGDPASPASVLPPGALAGAVASGRPSGPADPMEGLDRTAGQRLVPGQGPGAGPPPGDAPTVVQNGTGRAPAYGPGPGPGRAGPGGPPPPTQRYGAPLPPLGGPRPADYDDGRRPQHIRQSSGSRPMWVVAAVIVVAAVLAVLVFVATGGDDDAPDVESDNPSTTVDPGSGDPGSGGPATSGGTEAPPTNQTGPPATDTTAPFGTPPTTPMAPPTQAPPTTSGLPPSPPQFPTTALPP